MGNNSQQVNLSGFNVGESNVHNGNRLSGEFRRTVIEINKADRRSRVERLALHFKNVK